MHASSWKTFGSSASLLKMDAGSGRIRRVHLEDVDLGESKLRAVDFVDVIGERIDAANGDWGSILRGFRDTLDALDGTDVAKVLPRDRLIQVRSPARSGVSRRSVRCRSQIAHVLRVSKKRWTTSTASARSSASFAAGSTCIACSAYACGPASDGFR